MADGSQSLRKSGQFLYPMCSGTLDLWNRSRNPFVNQVSFFFFNKYQNKEIKQSQSLRKSGQFLYKEGIG